MKFKATVYVRLRVQVDDSPGNAVRDASRRLSDLDIKKLRLGKVIDLYFEAPDREYATQQLDLLVIDCMPILSWKIGILN